MEYDRIPEDYPLTVHESHMEYAIVSHLDLHQLIAKVNTAIADGWIPQGEIHSANSGWYLQAVTRTTFEASEANRAAKYVEMARDYLGSPKTGG